MSSLFWITYALVIFTLIALAYRDIKSFLLPNILNLNLLILMIALNFLSEWQIIDIKDAITGSIFAGLSLFMFKLIADKIYKQDSLGLGDVKFIFAAGIGVGFPNIFIVLTLGSLIGLIHGIILAKRLGERLDNVQVPAGLGFSIATIIILTLQIFTMLEINISNIYQSITSI